MESKVIARFVRIAPRKARVVVNMVRHQPVAAALDMLAFTRKAGAPIVKKLIESAIANAKQKNSSLNEDTLFVSAGAVDKGPNRNMRRWRPRAMGRATQIVKGVSHIQIVLSDNPPPRKEKKLAKTAEETPSAQQQVTVATETKSEG